MFDYDAVVKILCVALVAAVMLPAGNLVFPWVSDVLNGVQFHTVEAVVSTTLGFAISSFLG